MGSLRQIENEKYRCPFCNGRTNKAGISRNRKKRKRICKECNKTFTCEMNYNSEIKIRND